MEKSSLNNKKKEKKEEKKVIKFDSLSREQKMQLFFHKCETKEQFQKWIKMWLNVDLPDCTVSRFSNTNPLEVCWEIYDICVNKNNPQKIEEILCVAGRGSGKCVVKGTLIPTKYCLKKIENVKIGDLVWTGRSWKRVINFFNEGIKEGITIYTSSNQESIPNSLTGSFKHRVQAFNKETKKFEWTYLHDLKEGDLVYKTNCQFYYIDKDSEEFEEGWIHGFLLTQDCEKNIKFLHKYIDINKRILNSLNLHPNFLAGFFTGIIEYKGNENSITLDNKCLIEQLYYIACSFGIYSYITAEQNFYTLHFFNLKEELLPIFYKNNDFKIKHKTKSISYPLEVFEYIHSYLKINYEIEITDPNFNDLELYYNIAEELSEEELRKYIFFLKNGYCEKVVKKEEGEYYFYDLEVEEEHAYCSNFYISHNTLGMAVAEFAILIHDIRSIVHVGATQGQADRCYALVQNFILNNKIQPLIYPKNVKESQRIVKKLTISETVVNINGEKATLEVLPCTLKALNGPHVPLIVVDEIDTISGEGLKAYKEISGMLDSRGDKKALRVGISTRKSQHGLMNQQIESAHETGVSLRMWTCFEFSQPCPYDNDNPEPIDLYVDIYGFKVVKPEDYEKLEEKEKIKYSLVKFPEQKCEKCVIAPMCQGDAKNQKSKSKFLKPISDIIKKVKKEGPDWALAQLMNLKPSLEGIVFKEFNEEKHVKTLQEIWKIVFPNIPVPNNLSKQLFINFAKQQGGRIYCGVDFGWSSPSTATFLLHTRNNFFIILGTHGVVNVSKPNWLLTLKEKYSQIYRPDAYYIDTADPSDMVTAQEIGLFIGNKTSKKQTREYGVQLIKKLLYSLESSIPFMYLIKGETEDLIFEFKMFHYKTNTDGTTSDILDDEHDHFIDGLRYILVEICKQGANLSQDGIIDSSNEYKVIRGLGYKTEPKTLNELMQEEEKELVFGHGNVLFSF